MKKWISTKLKLPPIDMHVLCIIKASCSCEHYFPVVLVRKENESDWYWEASNPDPRSETGFIECPKEIVKSWIMINKFPNKYSLGKYQ